MARSDDLPTPLAILKRDAQRSVDFLRIEACLYRAARWPVLFPRTLWRVLRNPVGMSLQVRRQLKRKPEQRFSTMLSPPTLLILSIVLGHLVSPQFFASQLLQLAVQGITYALYALLPALAILRVRRTRITRAALHEPFYMQCYLASPLAIALSAANLLAGVQVALAMLLTGLACCWYLFAQIALLRRLLDLPMLVAAFIGISRFVIATLIALALADLLRSVALTNIKIF
ncbi:hypothetical protein D3C76_796940 [compost metagenome]